ncbi:hypothetical protein D1BOALGB6SA_1846 [Olavius sp. associated proteobacterium Delta 1]|nr:hypothetical protein D1BOALGB6SA_1846 [Olavius sp. associated proteobacterium Delta 1]
MVQAEAKRQEIIDEAPSSGPYPTKIILVKRKAQKDRRKINTFIADDRRSGIADRRKR